MNIARIAFTSLASLGMLVVATQAATLAGCTSEPAPQNDAPSFPLPADPLDPRHPWPATRQIDPRTSAVQVPRGALEAALDPGADGDRARELLAKVRAALADTNGAGITAVLRAPFDGDVDAASLAGHVRVVDRTGRDRPIEVAIVRGAIEITPARPWDADATYVAVVTGVRDVAGRRCRASEGVRAMLSGATGAAAEAFTAERAVVRDALAGAGIVAADVCLAFSFKTLDVAGPLRALEAGVAARAATPGKEPRATFVERRPPSEVKGLEGSAHVQEVLYGTFRSFDLRDASGKIPRERLGDTTLAPVELRFAVSVPRTGRAPYPVVMGLHGLGGSIDTTLPQYAELVGELGFAYVTIDGVAHGSRATSDNPQLAIVDLEDPRRSRDVFRQTLADLLQLRRTIDAGVARPDQSAGDLLERGHTRWSGGSYGGIFGTMMAAVDPGLEAAHVEACGGPWRDIILRGNVGLTMIGLLFSARTGMTTDMRDPVFSTTLARTMDVTQWVLDAADPSSLAEYIHRRPMDPARPPRVLMQYWVGETIMPNDASEVLARALAVPVNQTADDPAGVRAVWGYDLARWGAPSGSDGHGAFWKIPAARRQALAFLASNGTRIAQP
jgi:hypothetical protein